MKWLARIVSQRAASWIIVVAVALLALGSVSLALRLEQDEDILAFLPQDNPDVRLFYDINQRFGGTDLALIGVEVDDPFQPEFVARLKQVTERLDDLPALDHVLSLGNVIDFTPDEDVGGIITAPLVSAVPENAAESEALRAKVMSRDHVVGNLISRDGRAILIYCFLAYGMNPKLVAGQIRDIVEPAFAGHEIYWGGGPFISTYIYNTTQEDLRKLTPWAVLAIVAIMLLVFRDLVGTSVALLSTALGITISLGVMVALGVSFNIMLSSTPVVLFAIGSAYGLHILAHYYAHHEKHDSVEAMRLTLTRAGPVVVTAGLTTAASLLSFVCMDIAPVRTFGAFTSLGILITLALSVTFIPAVVCLTNLKGSSHGYGRVPSLTGGLALFARRHRRLVGALTVLLAVACGSLVGRVDTGVDMTTFFSEDSPPDRASRFMREHFGGSQFVQLHAKGDMTDPHVLRLVRRVADEVALLENVTSVTHIGDALAQSNRAMVGQLRIPDTAEQVKLLYTFVGTDPAVGQLVTRDRKQALIQIKLATEKSSEVNRVLDAITQIAFAHRGTLTVAEVRADAPETIDRRRELVVSRLRALLRQFGLPDVAPSVLSAGLEAPIPRIDRIKVAADFHHFLRSAECAVSPEEYGGPEVALSLSAAVAALGPDAGEDELRLRVTEVVGEHNPRLVDDLVLSLTFPLEEIWNVHRARGQARAVIAASDLELPEGEKGERFTLAMSTALLDLQTDTVGLLVPAGALTSGGPETGGEEVLTGKSAVLSTGEQSLSLQVNGLPVMHRGLSKSITRNQVLSLVFALALVLLIMSVVFRSPVSGLLATTPTMLTVLVIYGGMGAMGVHLDLGTSMLASIIMGAGVDYAVHLMAEWRTPSSTAMNADLNDAALAAARTTGPAIWTNAVMIGAGFLVLTLGEARPLKNVGSLTAAAMFVAALSTFLIIPALGRRRMYRRVDDGAEVVSVGGPAEASHPENLQG